MHMDHCTHFDVIICSGFVGIKASIQIDFCIFIHIILYNTFKIGTINNNKNKFVLYTDYNLCLLLFGKPNDKNI